MSSSGSTENYRLSQFSPNDTPSWLDDYNSDMVAIDAALGGINGKADTAQTTATTAKNTADSATTKAINAQAMGDWAKAIAGAAIGRSDNAQYTADLAQSAANSALPKTGGTIDGNLAITGYLSVPNGTAAISAWDLYARSSLFLNTNATSRIFSASTQEICFCPSTEWEYTLKYGVTGGRWGIHAHIDNQVNVGLPGYRMRDIYAGNSVISTSDRNMKKDIKALDDDKIVAFVKGLQACRYKSIDGDSGRVHYGFVAQDVEALMQELGMSSLDFAGFIKSPKVKTVFKEVEQPTGELNEDGTPVAKTVMEPISEEVPGEYVYGLRYEEFIPILWRYAQIIGAKTTQQDIDINELKARVSALENR